MRYRHALLASTVAVLGWPLSASGGESYEALQKKSEPVSVLKRMLLPFVASCDHERDHFRKLFCSALNERLKAQHQSKAYNSTFKTTPHGPLVVEYIEKPRPSMAITVKGCLTCREPMLERKGGDVSMGRFFVFKVPADIRITRGRYPYELVDIDLFTYRADLPAGMSRKKFEEEVLPFLRLDLLFRPEAGVEMVGKRYKYGVVTFELLAHRVYDKCSGKVFASAPSMEGQFLVDKNDLTCPQNQPKQPVAQVKLPPSMPQSRVTELMNRLAQDIGTCYEQFGSLGDVPADLVISPKGKVKLVKVRGKLAGTPTSRCVERLIYGMEFPVFSGEDARLHWPLSLRN